MINVTTNLGKPLCDCKYNTYELTKEGNELMKRGVSNCINAVNQGG